MESQLRDFFLQLKNRNLIGALNSRNLNVEHCVSTVIHHSLNGKVHGVVLVDDTNAIKGIYLCVIAQQWFDPSERCFSEMVLFILPEHRRGNHFKLMYNRIEQMSIDFGIHELRIGNSMRTDVEHFENVLKHSGFTPYPVYRKQL